MAHQELAPGHYHHFEPEQAYHSSKLAMWIFLATEVHLFGGLFCTFAIFRWRYLTQFEEYGRSLNWKLGALNTVILLTSSFLMVLAVDAAQKGLNKKVANRLFWTMICGIAFFIVKYFEWTHKFENNIYPSTHIFYGLYFTMTGIHAVHVLVGLGVMVWLWWLAKKERFSPLYYTPVEVTGLYWHLVDVVWIYLYPLLYLLGGISMNGAAH